MLTRNSVLLIVLLWLFVSPEMVNGKRILIITPVPLYSHRITFQPLWLALQRRGHELVVAAMSMNVTLSNYTEIDLSYLKNKFDDTAFAKYRLSTSRWETDKVIWSMHNVVNREIFKHPQMRRLYAPGSNEKFDLVIVEAFSAAAIFSFAHRFHAPLIGVASTEVFPYTRYLLGDLMLPSFPSNWQFDTNAGFNLPFWKRMANYLKMLAYIYRWTYIYMPQQQEVARKYLNVNKSDFYDTIRNMSLLFIARSKFTCAKPELPNIIFFDSLHITSEPPLLPKDLKDFLDSATEGFVYMSFGSSISLSMLSKEQLNTIITTFSKLPYKVLWKFDDENFPKKPDNVFIMKWFPQQGVLAHPNIKAFIYQGGVQSTDEAVYYAVPLIGIPLMYDQGYVINRLVEKGVARRVDFLNFSEANLATAIRDVLDNKRYKENMIALSELSKDKPVDDIERLVWWVEYVIRHNGAPHLRYNGANQPFYERYDMNIIALLAVTIFIITMLGLFILIKCLYFVWCRVLVDTIYKTSFCQASEKEKTS